MKRKLLVGGVLLSCLVLACWGMVQNSQEPVRYAQLPLLFLDGKLWKWTARSSPTYPVDVETASLNFTHMILPQGKKSLPASL